MVKKEGQDAIIGKGFHEFFFTQLELSASVIRIRAPFRANVKKNMITRRANLYCCRVDDQRHLHLGHETRHRRPSRRLTPSLPKRLHTSRFEGRTSSRQSSSGLSPLFPKRLHASRFEGRTSCRQFHLLRRGNLAQRHRARLHPRLSVQSLSERLLRFGLPQMSHGRRLQLRPDLLTFDNAKYVL